MTCLLVCVCVMGRPRGIPVRGLKHPNAGGAVSSHSRRPAARNPRQGTETRGRLGGRRLSRGGRPRGIPVRGLKLTFTWTCGSQTGVGRPRGIPVRGLKPTPSAPFSGLNAVYETGRPRGIPVRGLKPPPSPASRHVSLTGRPRGIPVRGLKLGDLHIQAPRLPLGRPRGIPVRGLKPVLLRTTWPSW